MLFSVQAKSGKIFSAHHSHSYSHSYWHSHSHSHSHIIPLLACCPSSLYLCAQSLGYCRLTHLPSLRRNFICLLRMLHTNSSAAPATAAAAFQWSHVLLYWQHFQRIMSWCWSTLHWVGKVNVLVNFANWGGENIWMRKVSLRFFSSQLLQWLRIIKP